jgi:hypothetical protein
METWTDRADNVLQLMEAVAKVRKPEEDSMEKELYRAVNSLCEQIKDSDRIEGWQESPSEALMG